MVKIIIEEFLGLGNLKYFTLTFHMNILNARVYACMNMVAFDMSYQNDRLYSNNVLFLLAFENSSRSTIVMVRVFWIFRSLN